MQFSNKSKIEILQNNGTEFYSQVNGEQMKSKKTHTQRKTGCDGKESFRSGDHYWKAGKKTIDRWCSWPTKKKKTNHVRLKHRRRDWNKPRHLKNNLRRLSIPRRTVTIEYKRFTAPHKDLGQQLHKSIIKAMMPF